MTMRTHSRAFVIAANLIGVALVSPAVASADETLINPLKSGSSLSGLLANILTFVVQLGAIVVVVMLVYTGFRYVTARGNSSEISKAHEMLKWTVIGALVLLGAQAIASAIQATVTALGG